MTHRQITLAGSDMTELELSYLAGLFDGEGHVSILKRRKPKIQYTLRIGITNTNLPVLLWVKELIGGNTKIHSGESRNRSTFDWYAQNTEAKRIILLILPYLHIKEEVAELGIEFQKTMGAFRGKSRPRLSKEILEKREFLKKKIQGINKKGHGFGA